MRRPVLFIFLLVLSVCAVQRAMLADAVSPDGKWVAYCRPAYDSSAEPITQVHTHSTKGSEERKIGELPGHVSDPFWIAPGKIALTEPYGTLNYLVIGVNGKRLADIALPQGCRVLYKSLSPDGKKIVFVGNYKVSEKDQYGLFVCDVRTGRVQRLCDKALKTNAAWSPDSRRLAIGAGEGYTKDYPLWIVDVETGKVEDTGTLGVGAAWSPDGRYIACTTEVARGGSWTYGIPNDGKLGVYDVAARKMRVLDGTDGAMLPGWSRSGKWIAYTAHGSLNLVGSDGANPHKIKDPVDPFGGAARASWLGDRAMYILTSTSVSRADISPAKVVTLAEWPKSEASDLKDSDFKTVEMPRVTVRFARFDQKYAEAFARILSAAVADYERMGFKMPERVTLEAYIDPQQTGLWTDGASALNLRLRSKSLLAPSTRTGVFNIYGMCHELGHVAMYPGLSNMMGLPAGVGQGWAHYTGSVVVSDVAQKLGKSIWPEPYDVADVEGMGRLKRQADKQLSGGWDGMDSDSRAGLVFYKMETDYGRDKVAAAMIGALDQHPMGKDLMPLMVKKLKDVTGEPKAGDWVPESVLVSKVEWKVKDRNPGDDFFADEKTSNDASGVELSYDDGQMDGKQSMSGSAETVLFRAPEGSWQLDGLKLFGGRYGTEEPPKEDFSIYICDADFGLLHTVRLPYSKFERGDEKWYDLTFDPVDVPRVFYVCVDFQATANKGVYVGIDSSVKRLHSYTAMPYSYVNDMKMTADWMIRAHLRPK